MQKVPIATAVLAACVFALVGCSGGGGNSVHDAAPDVGVADGTGSTPEPVQALEPPGDLPLPSVIRNSAVINSGVFHHGNQYEKSLPHQRLMENDESVAFMPVWVSSSLDNSSYAIYRFDSTGYPTDNTVHLGWRLQGDDIYAVWIGLANFVKDRWDWHHCPSGGQLPYDPLLYNAGGKVFVAVLCLGNDVWDLQTIRISDAVPPTVLAVTPLTCIHGEPTVFSVEVDGQVDEYHWSFGGGMMPNISEDAAPQVVAGDRGQYSASITAANAYGEDQFSFTYQITGIMISGTVRKADSGAYPGVSVGLEPGGQITTSDENGGFYFRGLTDGDYTLSAQLDIEGWSIWPEYYLITLEGEDATNKYFLAYAQPVAALSASPQSGEKPLTVEFNASPSNDPDNGGAPGAGITKYRWDWDNNGTFDYDSGSDAVVSHKYESKGLYSCRLQITDNEGETAESVTGIEVVNTPPYSASGYVHDNLGEPVAGVTISFGGTLDAVMTDETGYWIRDGLVDGVYTATPSKNAWWFEPASDDFVVAGDDVTGVDFQGNDRFRVSGGCYASDQVLQAVVNATITFTDSEGATSTTLTDLSGAYMKHGLMPGTYTVTPSLPGWTFTPASKSVTIESENLTGINFSASYTDFWAAFGHDAKHTRRSVFTGPAQPRLRWTVETGGEIDNAAPVTGADGTIYIGNHARKLVAYAPDGTQLWTYSVVGEIDNSAAIDANGKIYIISQNYLYSLHPGGTLDWTYQTGGYSTESPVIGSDGTIYVACRDCKLYAVNPDGTLKWQYTGGSAFITTPAIDDNGTLYIGNQDRSLYAVNPDGSVKWISGMLGAQCSTPAVGADGTVYISSYINTGGGNGRLYAFDATGAVKWTYLTENNSSMTSLALSTSGIIYVGSDDQHLYALDPDGYLEWSLALENIASSPVVDGDGTVYVCLESGSVRAVTPSGFLKWAYETNDPFQSDIAIGADGSLYIANQEGVLFAFGPGGGV